MKTTYQELQKMMIAAMGLKVGDRVEITRTSKKGEMGWPCHWPSTMNEFVGHISEIDSFDSDGEGVLIKETRGYVFPIFVLRKVVNSDVTIALTSDYDAVIDHNGITKVGCQTIPFEKLKEVYDAAAKQRGI